jgi:nicotinate-nucleotide adenylyltransferase
MKRFGLDQVWWMVSPGNPLKAHGPQPISERIDYAHGVMDHPRVKITDIECHLGTRYTAQTLDKLFRLYPGVRFVWLMGADNLAEFHRWDQWKWIMNALPVGVIARPGQRVAARLSPAARIFGARRLKGQNARALAGYDAPIWSLVNVPMLPHSSSEIRARGDWAS